MAANSLPQLTIPSQTYAAEDPKGWDSLFAQATAADSAGIDSLLASDHVVFGERLDEYGRPEIGGQAGGKQPTGPDGHWLEPLTALSVVAGMTKRIRLRTFILIAALRRPVVLAKSAATLDVLSGGRLDLGVGVGWQKEEYDAAGLLFEGRGKLLDHTLAVCQTLWRDQRASFASPQLSFENIHQMPKPLQPGGVPIWTSGTIRKTTARRIARFGPRWIPWGPDAENLVESLPRMKDAVIAEGGSVEGFQVVGFLPTVRDQAGKMDIPRTMDGVPRLVDSGITDFICNVAIPDEYQGAIDTLSPIVEAFRAVTGRPMPGGA